MRLEFDARARRLLRRLPAVNVYSAAELLLLAGLAVQTARLVWAIVTPVGPLGDWRPAEPAVPGSPSALIASFDPFFRLSATSGPATVTSLQLKLFGTRVDEASGRGSAIVAGPDGLQRSIAVGEEVAPGVALKAVAFDHVTLAHGGKDEDLYLDQSGAAPAGPPPPVAVGSPLTGAVPASPAAAPGALSIAQLRTDVLFTPRLGDGRLTGLVVHPQGAGAAFRAAGLQDGDVVTSIGGRPVTGAGDLDRIAGDYRTGGTLPITVERGGQPTPLSLPIAPAP